MSNEITLNEAKIASSIQPEELNDLSIIYKKYALMKELQDNIDTWQENYVLSFLKNYDEVMEYIPEKHLDEYKSNYCELYRNRFSNGSDFEKTKQNAYDFLSSILKAVQRKIKGYDNQPMIKFIVDTSRKQIIEIDLSDLENLEFSFKKEPNAKFIQKPYYAQESRFNNTGYYDGICFHKYDAKSTKEVLCLIGKSTYVHHNRFNYGKAQHAEHFRIAFNAETNEFGYIQKYVEKYN